MFFDFERSNAFRPEIGNGGAHDDQIGFRGLALHDFGHLNGGFDTVETEETGGSGQSDGTRDENRFEPARDGGRREGIAHFSGGAVGDKSDRVNRFAGRTGADDDSHSAPSGLKNEWRYSCRRRRHSGHMKMSMPRNSDASLEREMRHSSPTCMRTGCV